MTSRAQSPASRKSAERQRRKDAGEVRVEVWLDKRSMRDLAAISDHEGLSASEAIKLSIWRTANPIVLNAPAKP